MDPAIIFAILWGLGAAPCIIVISLMLTSSGRGPYLFDEYAALCTIACAGFCVFPVMNLLVGIPSLIYFYNLYKKGQ